MSLKNRFFSILTVALGVVMFSTFTMAQTTTTPVPEKAEKRVKGERGLGKGEFGHKAEGRHHGKRGGMMHGLRDLNLTDAQKAQIKLIHDSNKPDAATMTEFQTIRDARKAGTPITPEQKERMKVLREQSRSKAKGIHEQMLAVLTAEQKAQFETKKVEMRQRREERKLNHKQRPTTDKPVIK